MNRWVDGWADGCMDGWMGTACVRQVLTAAGGASDAASLDGAVEGVDLPRGARLGLLRHYPSACKPMQKAHVSLSQRHGQAE